MSTLLKPLPVRQQLLNRQVKIFTSQTFARIFSVPPYTAKYFLEKQVHEGLLLRLKQGLYTLKTDPPSEEEVANALYQPSYLSFEYALAYYNLLPEMPHTITSATTKPTRLFTTESQAFSYRSIQVSAYAGYTLIKQNLKSFLIAEPEKALVDYLYFVTLNRLPQNDRLIARVSQSTFRSLTHLNQQKIFNYAQLFRHPRLAKLLHQIL